MWVTLYTDASLKDSAGGWAIWAKSSKGRIIDNGPYPGPCKVSDHAEAFAILMGVKRVLSEWDNVTGIQVNSDSRNALKIIESHSRRSSNKVMAAIQQKIREHAAAKGVILRGKWVKAHQNSPDSVRAYLNNACDAAAKSGRTENIDPWLLSDIDYFDFFFGEGDR